MLLCAGFIALPLCTRAADADEATPYPLSKCIVSGEKFGGDMGKPFSFVYQGREIKLCCKSCQKDFTAKSGDFLKKIDAAAKEAAAKHPYPLKTCVVSGDKLEGDMGKPFAFVYDEKEVKLCCKTCLADFKKSPEKYMKQLAQAQKTGAK